MQDLIERLLRLADFRGISPTNPIIFRLKNLGKEYQVIVSLLEPSYSSLPFNIVWLVANKNNKDYKKVLRRTARNPQNGYKNTWEEITEKEQIYEEQYYDLRNTFLLGEIDLSHIEVGPATEEKLGIFKLVTDSESHTIIENSDSRLFDDRVAIHHVHDPHPILEFKNSHGNISIHTDPPQPGQILSLNEGKAQWKFPSAEDVANYIPFPIELIIEGPDFVEERTSVQYNATVQYSNHTSQSINPIWSINPEYSGIATVDSNGLVTFYEVEESKGIKLNAEFTDEKTNIIVSSIKDILVTFVHVPTHLEIVGPNLADTNSFTHYKSIIHLTDGTSYEVYPTWSLSDESFASITPDGILTIGEVSETKFLVIKAVFDFGYGIIVEKTFELTVANEEVPVPSSIKIIGPDEVIENETAIYYAEVTLSDGTVYQVQNPEWILTSDYAQISEMGELTVNPLMESHIIELTVDFTLEDVTVSATKSINLTPSKVIEGVEIHGPNTIDENTEEQYSLHIRYTNGFTEPVTEPVTWRVDDTEIASIGNLGILSTFEIDSNIDIHINAETFINFTSYAAHKVVTIIDTTKYFESMEIVGPDVIEELNTQVYQLNVHFSDSSSELLPATSWNVSDNTYIELINQETGEITVEEVTGDQQFVLYAEFHYRDVIHTAEKQILIKDVTVYPESMIIIGDDTIDQSTSKQYSAQITYVDGSTKEVQPIWSTNNELVTIDVNGLATAGFTTVDTMVNIFAEYTEHGITLNAFKEILLVAKEIEPTELIITGEKTEINEGEFISLQALVTFSNGDQEDVTVWNECAWESLNPEYAEIVDKGTVRSLPIDVDQEVVIKAVYTHYNGVSVENTYAIMIRNIEFAPVYGIGPGGGSDNDFVNTYLTNELPLPIEDNQTFTVNITENNFGYFAVPAKVESVTFVDVSSGFSGGWDGATWPADGSIGWDTGPLIIEVTKQGITEEWLLYRTDFSGIGEATYRVTYGIL